MKMKKEEEEEKKEEEEKGGEEEKNKTCCQYQGCLFAWLLFFKGHCLKGSPYGKECMRILMNF